MVTTGAQNEGEEEEGKCAWIFNVSDAAPAVATRADLLRSQLFHFTLACRRTSFAQSLRSHSKIDQMSTTDPLTLLTVYKK